DPDCQLLQQPVPDSGAVLRPDHSGDHDAACRHSVPRDGVAVRYHATGARLHPHRHQLRAASLQCLRRRRAYSAVDVDYLGGASHRRSAMTPAARLAAAIEVFASIESERRPAADVLKSWGVAHRFAGSGDRAAIAGLVYDALRRKASSAWIMGADTPRAVLLGMLARERGLDVEEISKLANGARFAPEPLSDDEHARLRA